MISFERDGISFSYPENWTTDTQETEDGGWGFVVSSPQTAFVLVTLRPDARDPTDLADQTLDALKADYTELDAENRVETIAGQVAIGHDIDFMTIDTPITCRTRCLESPAGPLLTMIQTSEYDRAESEPILRAIVASLRVNEE